MSLQVKLYTPSGEIRRFNLDGNATFSALQQRIRDLTGNDNLRLFWQDSEGDFVICGSDDEFNEAKSMHKPGNPLRIFAKPGRPTASENVHQRVTCDGCRGAVAGTRYKCLECPDYDLCEKCMGERQHAQHDMLAIRTPGTHAWKKAFAQGYGNRAGFRPAGCPRFARPGCGPCRPPNCGPFQPGTIPPFVRHMMETFGPVIDKTVEMDIDLNKPLQEVIGDVAKNITEALNTVSQSAETERQQEPKQATTTEEKKQEQETADFVTAMASAVADAVNVVSDALKEVIPEAENGWTHLQPEPAASQSQTEEPQPSTSKSEEKPVQSEGSIEAALRAMEEMGFPNEGNLLRRLLINYKGDISRVLDSIK
ncbi:sequestosome-1-like [Paramacrobiotus metropolitanus]|uniref:sequestosome-1-like n=1 Tax=Paramacrobiotus metropolitanus TaxID=2943436 RepID=UPI00244587ED|nr:sequestosome-1-like [Paramacrobiotus metropolitanus]